MVKSFKEFVTEGSGRGEHYDAIESGKTHALGSVKRLHVPGHPWHNQKVRIHHVPKTALDQYRVTKADRSDPRAHSEVSHDELREESITEHIVKVNGGYELKSKKTGKNLGKAKTKGEIEKREKEVEYFKHHQGK